jgi:hypothetical protein
MVWCSRQDRMGDLPGLWPILSGQGLGQYPQKQTPLPVDPHLSGGDGGPVPLDDPSFPA